MTNSERTYQDQVMPMINTIVEQLQPFTLEDRIRQWREQAASSRAESKDGDYLDGRAFAFERCADEAELTLRAGVVPSPRGRAGEFPEMEKLTAARWQRLYNLVAHLAHPKGDHRTNELEDEAHDLIRELRDTTALLARVRELEQARDELRAILTDAAGERALELFGGRRGGKTAALEARAAPHQTPDETKADA
jgi:hypothetical protein